MAAETTNDTRDQGEAREGTVSPEAAVAEHHAALEAIATLAGERDVVQELDALLERLDKGIAAERVAMDALLSRLKRRAA